MNHKRKGPKSTRAGCLMCKPQKHQRVAKEQRRLHRDRKRIHEEDSCHS